MPHVVVEVDADVPADRVMAAATDFSERRPEVWPNISREFWQLHGHGPNWAEATEGSPAVWARERHEWSDNRRTDGRSHIRMVLDRRWKGKGWFFCAPVALFGRQMFKRNLRKTLNVLASSRG
jgi:hypothetical protein